MSSLRDAVFIHALTIPQTISRTRRLHVLASLPIRMACELSVLSSSQCHLATIADIIRRRVDEAGHAHCWLDEGKEPLAGSPRGPAPPAPSWLLLHAPTGRRRAYARHLRSGCSRCRAVFLPEHRALVELQSPTSVRHREPCPEPECIVDADHPRVVSTIRLCSYSYA